MRGLRTNFYTYQGVVKALDGIDLDVRQGETVGIVGETGCGKSVTALSVLRLIPQPPGKIEAGEALVDVDEEMLAEIERLKAEVRGALREVFGGTSDYATTAVTVKLLDRIRSSLGASRTISPDRKAQLLKSVARLRELLGHHDLLSLSAGDLQEVRGSVISMIFQEPMQALNPVFTIGDQIAESIVLHRRRWLNRRTTLRMRAENLRRRVLARVPWTLAHFVVLAAVLLGSFLAVAAVTALASASFFHPPFLNPASLLGYSIIVGLLVGLIGSLRPTRPHRATPLALGLLGGGAFNLGAYLGLVIFQYLDPWGVFQFLWGDQAGGMYGGTVAGFLTAALLARYVIRGRLRDEWRWDGVARSHLRRVAGAADLEYPSRSDLRLLVDALERDPSPDARAVREVKELLAFEELLGELPPSVYARYFPRRVQLELYERESLGSAWRAADVVEELHSFASFLGITGEAQVPWGDMRATGPFEVAITPPSGLSPEAATDRLRELVSAREGPAAAWSALGTVLAPPRVEGARVVLTIQPPFRRSKPALASFLVRIPFLKREVLHPLNRTARDEAAKVLRLLKIADADRVVTNYPHELSGGMNQRAMIAIALACDPLLLIADEPTTALDVTIQAQILELLRDLKSRGRPSLLLITHDLGVIAEMADRVAVMYAGHVIETAPVKEIFRSPLHPYTRGLLKAIPSHAERKDRLEVIKGSVPNLIYPPSGCRFHPRCPAVLPHCGWDTKDLEPAVRKLAADLGIPAEAIEDVDGKDPFVLRVTFAPGDGVGKAMDAIEARVAGDRASSVLLQAVTGVAREGSDLVFTMIKAKRPRDLEVSPGHVVACYLYDEAPEAA